MSDQNFHFFASCTFSWGTGDTLDEAVTNMCKGAGTDTIRTVVRKYQKDSLPGLYFWHCKVNAPKSEEYNIEYYMPKGVKTDDQSHAYIVYATGSVVKFWTAPEDLYK